MDHAKDPLGEKMREETIHINKAGSKRLKLVEVNDDKEGSKIVEV